MECYWLSIMAHQRETNIPAHIAVSCWYFSTIWLWDWISKFVYKIWSKQNKFDYLLLIQFQIPPNHEADVFFQLYQTNYLFIVKWHARMHAFRYFARSNNIYFAILRLKEKSSVMVSIHPFSLVVVFTMIMVQATFILIQQKEFGLIKRVLK